MIRMISEVRSQSSKPRRYRGQRAESKVDMSTIRDFRSQKSEVKGDIWSEVIHTSEDRAYVEVEDQASEIEDQRSEVSG